MKLSEKVSFGIALTAVPAQSAGFSVPGLIVNASEVPIYQRIRSVTRGDRATILDTTTTAAAWADDLWADNSYNVATAYIIRWAEAATPSQFVMKDFGSTIATWQAVTAGDFGLSIGGVPTALVTTGTMAGVSDMDDVAAIVETAVQAEGGDWATCTVEIDVLGNFVLSNSDTGAASDSVSIIAPTGGAGTNITTADYLNITSQAFEVAGLDAEDPDDALAAALAIEDEIRIIHEIGASIAQQTSLATACASYQKILLLNVRDEDAKDSSATTDIAYILEAASNSYTFGMYTEHTGDYPSATINGQILTRPEGSAIR